jgi:peptidoglycan/LPS O-acetylase OafA/YrhL
MTNETDKPRSMHAGPHRSFASTLAPRVNDVEASAAYARFRSVKFFSSLDGLRAFSIVAVIWHHTADVAVPASLTLLHHGNRGVTLFFVISAFLISTLLLRAREKGAIDVPRFWARRALRIMPLFYAVLGLYLVVVTILERDPAARAAFFENLPAFATFTSNWFVDLEGSRVIFYFAWSLAAEEQFYLCWPWVERFCSRWWPVVVAGALLVLSQAAGFFFGPDYQGAFAMKILGSIPAAILLGVGLAHGLASPRVFAAVWTFAGRKGSALGALGLTGVALSLEPALGFAGELASSAAMTVLVATCVIREDNALSPVLRLRPIAWIGTISYGIYLFHMLAANAARRILASAGIVSPYADFILGTLLSIAVATLSYLTFERFFLRWKDRWFAERGSGGKKEPSGRLENGVRPMPFAAPLADTRLDNG